MTLYDESIQILIHRPGDAQIPFTNVENGFVIDEELRYDQHKKKG